MIKTFIVCLFPRDVTVSNTCYLQLLPSGRVYLKSWLSIFRSPFGDCWCKYFTALLLSNTVVIKIICIIEHIAYLVVTNYVFDFTSVLVALLYWGYIYNTQTCSRIFWASGSVVWGSGISAWKQWRPENGLGPGYQYRRWASNSTMYIERQLWDFNVKK